MEIVLPLEIRNINFICEVNILDFFAVANTDIGTRKSVNQDSFLVKLGNTQYGNLCMAIICDGVGGLEHGEVASQNVIKLFKEWFSNELKNIVSVEIDKYVLDESIENVVNEANELLIAYGSRNNIRLGTTLSLILFINNTFYTYHIGDSRIYKIDSKLYQLTQDHTLVAAKVKNGQISKEEARVSKEKHILLQCIGTNDSLKIDKNSGKYDTGDVFFICSDGLYNNLEEDEILRTLKNRAEINKETMKNSLNSLIQMVKHRGETDNITGIVIKIM